MKLLQVMRDNQFLAGVAIDFNGDDPTLRDSGVLNGSSEIKKTGAISASYLFAMNYLASKGYSSVSFGLSRSFLDDGVLNYKRKFRPIITTGNQPGRQDRNNRAGWLFGINAESVVDVSGDALRNLAPQ